MKENNSPKAILFDFDGTLADSFEAAFNIGNQLAAKYGYPKLTRTEAAGLRNKGIGQILRESGLPLRRLPAWLHEFRKMLRSSLPEMKPHPGIHENLQKLLSFGIRLGIVTSNSVENVRLFLHANNWQNSFSWIECGSGLFGKHRLINRILRQNNLPPDQVIYVGDEIRDIESARNAGVFSAAVTWGFNSRSALASANPDIVLESPSDLPGLLQILPSR